MQPIFRSGWRAWPGVIVIGLSVVALAACRPVTETPAAADTQNPHAAMGGMPGMAGVPYDPSRIPAPWNGIATPGILPTSEKPQPSPDGTGDFRTVCRYSHFAADDPIVLPGQPGASHLHVFWGNTRTDDSSTAASLLASGNGTCRGGTVNRTGYWAPALVDTRTGTPIAPSLIHVYYKSGYQGIKPNQVHPMPVGLRMIAGDSKATAPQEYTQWKCWSNGKRFDHISPCGQGDFVTMSIDFPQCWDGQNLDSTDHKSHMAYGNGDGKGCPADHPVAIPAITFNLLYAMPKNGDVSSWRLASDTYGASRPAGYSIHGDWFDGWQQDIVDAWVNNCVRKTVTCGSHLLGDGRMLDQYGIG